MVERRAQGWPWEAVAAEAEISVRSAKEAAAKLRAEVGLAFRADPLKVVEDIMLGLQTSIVGLEMLSVRYQDSSPNAAIGAKRAANDARQSVLVLLQATGRLPEDLMTLRHLIEQRQMAVTMLDTMELFRTRISDMPEELPPAVRDYLDRAVADVQGVFEDLIGLREGVASLEDRGLLAPSGDLPDIEGEASDPSE